MTSVGTWSKVTLNGQEYLALLTVSEEPGQQLTFVAQVYADIPRIEWEKYKIEGGKLRGPAFSDVVQRTAMSSWRLVTGRSFSSFDGALEDAARQLGNPA